MNEKLLHEAGDNGEPHADEGQLRSMFEAARVGIVLCDVDGAISFSNQYADYLWGRRHHNREPGDWLSFIHGDDRAAVEAMLVDVSSGGPSRSMRYRIEEDDEATRWVDHTATTFRGSDGRLQGSVSTLTNVTIEVEAANGLLRSRVFDEALLDTVGALVVVIDPEQRILRFNRTCESVTGWAPDEVIGRPFLEFLVPPEEHKPVEELFARLLSNQPPTSMENDWITKDGHRRRINWSNTVITDSVGKIAAVIATGIDVTDQRLLESRYAQTDRLESIGRLAAGVAHDFNNTLTVLQLRIECIVATDEKQRHNLDALKRTLEHSQATIADLVAFSRHQELTPTPTDVNAEIERLTEMLRDLLGGHIDVVLDLTTDDSTAVFDPSRFEQVVVNLVLNAHDAMPEGGVLTVRTAVADLDGRELVHPRAGAPLTSLPPGRYLCLTVTDTGSGIEPHHLDRVFEPYFTTKPNGRGTGLGLATAYGTVTQSGGALAVTSELGNGSSFMVWLPQPAATLRRADLASSHRPTTVLLVEDDNDLREILAEELRSLDHGTIEAPNGRAGLEQIGRPIDLLVTDVQMPGIDGITLAAAFAANSPDSKVLFMTGLIPVEVSGRLPSGAPILRKPFTTDEFRAAVSRLLPKRDQ
ncbi:MAG: PAS domain S-box protein [Ilumatobacteraceae bacterium]